MVTGSITKAKRFAHSLLPLDSYQLASGVCKVTSSVRKVTSSVCKVTSSVCSRICLEVFEGGDGDEISGRRGWEAWRFRRDRDEIGRVLTVRCFVGCNRHKITMMTRPFVKRQEKSNEVIERRSEESDAERMGEGRGAEVRGRGAQEEEGDGEKETREGRKQRRGRRRKSRRQRRKMGRRYY